VLISTKGCTSLIIGIQRQRERQRRRWEMKEAAGAEVAAAGAEVAAAGAEVTVAEVTGKCNGITT